MVYRLRLYEHLNISGSFPFALRDDQKWLKKHHLTNLLNREIAQLRNLPFEHESHLREIEALTPDEVKEHNRGEVRQWLEALEKVIND
jgi:hypothetical protein